MITPEELLAIKARAEKATPGPWFYEEEIEVLRADQASFEAYGPFGRYKTDSLIGTRGDFYNWRDADFITHAREDIPALVAEVERLNTMLALRCTWTDKGSHDGKAHYSTSCEIAFVGDISGVKFCPYCGRLVQHDES